MWTLLVLVSLALVRAEEKCCYDTSEVPAEVGCYNDEFPFDNMPLPNCNDFIQVSTRVFTRDNIAEGQVITKTTVPPVFDPSRRTHILCHGWLGTRHSPWMNGMKDYLLQEGDYNIIITGWNKGSRQAWYPQSASDTKVVGTELALTVKNLVDNFGSNYEDFYCAGHSLGSHVCGHTGQRANYWGNFGRITGLDPAGPWFENKDHPDIGLDATDALLVDVMHTNGEANIIMNLGTMKPLGHMDFYPNGGGTQPGCILDPLAIQTPLDLMNEPEQYIDLWPACSHLRVLHLYSESIRGCNYFTSQICDDPYNLPGSCQTNGNVLASMGFRAEEGTTYGNFYLETNTNDPYCTEW